MTRSPSAAHDRRDRRVRLVALHGWVGLLAGWLLFAVFLTGTLSVFDSELTLWMEPEIISPTAPAPHATSVAEAYLRTNHPDAASWTVTLPDPRIPALGIAWCDRNGTCGSIAADDRTGRVARRTRGGNVFFEIHYSLLAGGLGEVAVGLTGLAGLATVLSGVIVHARRLLPDLFTLRVDGAASRSLRDLHVLGSVATLPFLVVFLWSGVLIFAFLTLPSAWHARYGRNLSAYFADSDQQPLVAQVANQNAATTTIPLTTLLTEAERVLGPGLAGTIVLTNPGRAGARLEITERDGVVLPLRRRTVLLSGATGAILAPAYPAHLGVAARATTLLVGIHFARWGGTGLRLLYAMSGLIATGAVGAGLFLFDTRRARLAASGFPYAFIALSQRITPAATFGLVAASLALLWANRVLPAGWRAARPDAEIACMLGTWLATLLACCFARDPRIVSLHLVAALGLLLWPLDAVTAPAGLFGHVRLSVDFCAEMVGCAALALAHVIARSR